MNTSKFLAVSCFSLVTALAAASPVQAQLLRPQGSIPDGNYQQAQGLDAAGLSVRLDRLENQVRSQNGQIEQLQFQIKRLEDQLRKFQQDVEFRFQETGGKGGPARQPAPAPAPGRRTDLNENGYQVLGQGGVPVDAAPPAPTVGTGRFAGRRGDAFDPSTDPDAPGAPRDLGSLPAGANAAPPPLNARVGGPLPTGPLDDLDDMDPNAPLDLMRHPSAGMPRGPVTAGLGQSSLGLNPQPAPQLAPPAGPAPRVIPAPAIAGGPAAGQSVATIPPAAAPVDEYELGAAALKDGQYEAAEQRFRSYLEKHPKDRLAADATFYLGESYFRRSRPREAAEQYLKVSTDFPKAVRAPESLLKLGLSLEKLGAKEQACAAYGEVGRKYPGAAGTVRASADREIKRAQC